MVATPWSRKLSYRGMGSLRKPAQLWLALPQDMAVSARLSAIGEPGFVLIAGTLLSGVVLSHLHLLSPGHYLFKTNNPDFASAATVLLIDLAVLYAFVLSFAALLGLWRGRSTLLSYGISRGHRRFDALLGTGILVGLTASLPEQILRVVNAYTPLGPAILGPSGTRVVGRGLLALHGSRKLHHCSHS